QTSASFVSGGACGKTAGALSCSQLYISASRIPAGSEFWTTQAPAAVVGGAFQGSGWTVCTGGPYNGVVVSTAFISPVFVGSLIPGFSIVFNSQRVHVTSARIAFVNFGFTQTSTC
ncbi:MULTISPECIES: hypothetical protein, partial [Streptomyces]